MVCNQQTGKWKGKAKIDFRLQDHQQIFQNQAFQAGSLEKYFPYLKKGMGAAKIDLKNAYFHLELEKILQPYIRVQVAGDIYQFQAACFGISTLPQLWMHVMKVFQKFWRKKGIMCFIYVDDILVLNTTPQGVEKDLAIMLETLRQAGMVVNFRKSILAPTQKLDHLGFSLDLENGMLEVLKYKLKAVRKELGKLLTHKEMTCRKMATILGNIRSFLMAMPFLRAFTDHMVAFVNQQGHWGWDIPLEITQTLQQEVSDLNSLTKQWNGRPFQERTVNKKLNSDSSNHAWAGIDVQTGTVVQEFWRERNGLHINVKELEAAIQTIQSLAKTGEMVHLSVDNSVAFAYLTRGGKITPFKQTRERFLEMDHGKQHPSKDSFGQVRTRPSGLLVQGTSGQGRLQNGQIFFFAPAKKDVPFYQARHRHVCVPWKPSNLSICIQATTLAGRQARCLEMQPPGHNKMLCKSPWTVIGDWLNRLWDNPHLTCMMITPYWVGAPWWPLLVKMQCPQSPAYIIPPYHGMFQNCLGEYMRAPKWPLLCSVLSGRHWKPNKYKLRTLTLF